MTEDGVTVHLSERQLRIVIQNLGALLADAGKAKPQYVCPTTRGYDIEELYMLSSAFVALIASLE